MTDVFLQISQFFMFRKMGQQIMIFFTFWKGKALNKAIYLLDYYLSLCVCFGKDQSMPSGRCLLELCIA